jgi:hypothetical protein
MVAQTCNSSYISAEVGKPWFKASPKQKSMTPYLKNNSSKMDWELGSSKRTPA